MVKHLHGITQSLLFLLVKHDKRPDTEPKCVSLLFFFNLVRTSKRKIQIKRRRFGYPR